VFLDVPLQLGHSLIVRRPQIVDCIRGFFKFTWIIDTPFDLRENLREFVNAIGVSSH
jgi:hypothetical protein